MTQDEALRMQIKVLADRLALVIAMCDDEAVECWLEGSDESAKFWDHLKTILLCEDEASLYKQAELRGSTFYEPAKTEVRDLMRKVLRSFRKAA